MFRLPLANPVETWNGVVASDDDLRAIVGPLRQIMGHSSSARRLWQNSAYSPLRRGAACDESGTTRAVLSHVCRCLRAPRAHGAGPRCGSDLRIPSSRDRPNALQRGCCCDLTARAITGPFSSRQRRQCRRPWHRFVVMDVAPGTGEREHLQSPAPCFGRKRGWFNMGREFSRTSRDRVAKRRLDATELAQFLKRSFTPEDTQRWSISYQEHSFNP